MIGKTNDAFHVQGGGYYGNQIGKGLYVGEDPRRCGFLSAQEISHYSFGFKVIENIFISTLGSIHEKEETFSSFR